MMTFSDFLIVKLSRFFFFFVLVLGIGPEDCQQIHYHEPYTHPYI